MSDHEIGSMAKPENPTNQEHKFGWFSFTPRLLQALNKGIWVLVFLTATNTIASGTYNGLSGAVQSSIETRFQLTSVQSSWIMTSFDVAAIFASVIVTYIGSKPKCHRTRIVAIGIVASTVGCILYVVPHFTTGTYIPADDPYEDDNLCRNRTNEDICSDFDNKDIPGNYALQNYLGVFIIARILLSFGVTPITMLGLTYLDDCVSKETFSFYSGIFVCGWIGGPALGFVFGGLFLSIFTDFYSEDHGSPDIDASDPRWVGAWWLGFIVSAILFMIVTLPMAGFPIDLPGAAEIRQKKKTEAFNHNMDGNATMKVDFTSKDIIPYITYLFTNWTFLFLSLFVTCDIAIMAGFTVFGAKFIEVQYNLTAGQAGVLFGILVVPAALIGSISGGAIVKMLRLGLIDILKWSIGLSVIIVVGGAFMLFSCPDQIMAGVNSPYPDLKRINLHSLYADFNISDECNSECWCEDISFSPVCYRDEIQFYSACHAGCSYKENDVYENCNCIGNETQSSVQVGVCTSNWCNSIIYFIILIFILMVALFINCAMDMTAMVRSVPPTHRVMAFLIYNTLQKILGAVPAPLIFGIAFDYSCVVWEEDCGERGSCYYYDKQTLGLSIYITCICYKLLSIVFIILSWQLYKPPKDINPIMLDVGNRNSDKTVSDDSRVLDSKDGGYLNGDINKAFDCDDIPIPTDGYTTHL